VLESSLPGSSWTFARCLRLITRPIKPTATSMAPASISQGGNSNHPIAVLSVPNLLHRLQFEAASRLTQPSGRGSYANKSFPACAILT
jgi:hypothetical protein